MKKACNKLLLCFMVSLLFALFFVSSSVFAIDIPKHTDDFYVNDFANVFTNEQKKTLVDEAKKLAEKPEGIQVVISTIKTIKGNSIEDYAREMYNKYAIGKDDMGVLILLVTEDRDVRMEIGRTMEIYINDAKVGRLLDINAIPYFADDDFSTGLIKLQEATITEINAMVAGEETTIPEDKKEIIGDIILIIVVIILVFLYYYFGDDTYYLGGSSGWHSGGSSSGGSSGFGGRSFGGGGSRHF